MYPCDNYSTKVLIFSTFAVFSGNYSCLQVALEWRRDLSQYWSDLFLPDMVLVATSFLTFWLDWSSVPARSANYTNQVSDESSYQNVSVIIFCVSFIAYDQVILEFGIEKFKKVILFGSALLPIVIVLLAQGTILIPNHDRTLSNMDIRCIESLRISNFSEPTLHRQTQLYMLVQKYLPSSLITCIKAFCYVVVLVCISNVLEGFIYWHTWSIIKRYW